MTGRGRTGTNDRSDVLPTQRGGRAAIRVALSLRCSSLSCFRLSA
jgi:hypothetical protein